MTTNSNPTPLIIPIIRTLMPSLIAQQIVGVQPMTSPAIFGFDLDYPIVYHTNPRRQFSRQWHESSCQNQDYEAVQQWCTENFGPQPKCPDAWCRWYRYRRRAWRFRDQEDYVLFRLRWAG